MTKKYIYMCKFPNGRRIYCNNKKSFIDDINHYKNDNNINHLDVTVNSINNYYYKNTTPSFIDELQKDLYKDKFKIMYNLLYNNDDKLKCSKTISHRYNKIAVEFLRDIKNMNV